ncbi:MAG: efflux RND transporter periplasmic adaptor subunit [Rhodocyclaceae bacterium]
MTPTLPAALALAGLLALSACSKKAEEKKPGPPPTQITVTQAREMPLETIERTLGTLEAINDPKIAAEVAGRITRIAVRSGESVKKGQLLAELDPSDTSQQLRSDQGEITRLEALLAQQERLLNRQSELVQKNFISKNALDDATAQRDALRGQLEAARGRAGISGNNLKKTRVLAPFDGVIEEQLASTGDYVKLGDPLFRLVSNAVLRAHLPFPESAAQRFKRGQTVRLVSPLLPGQIVKGEVEDIRPTLTETSRSIDVIARVENNGELRGGGSVDASVVIGQKDKAILVPEQSVVLRPAGKVVYAIANDKAQQRVVETGSKQAGLIEIVSGVAAGETLALDGAGFLSNGASVHIQERPSPGAKPASKPAEAAK